MTKPRPEFDPSDRVLRKPDVEEITGLTERTLRDMERAGTFPRRFFINPYGRVVGWKESEIQAWIDERAATRSSPSDREDREKKGRVHAPLLGEERGASTLPFIPEWPSQWDFPERQHKRRGRHPGVPNKITRDVNELAQKHGIDALIRALAKLILMRDGKS